MAYRYGDVILVPFPFTDQSSSKKRPAAVISGDAYNKHRPDIVIVAITSQIRTPLGYAEASITDWQSAGLIKASVIKPVFATLEQGLVLRVMGTLSDPDLRALDDVIAQSLRRMA